MGKHRDITKKRGKYKKNIGCFMTPGVLTFISRMLSSSVKHFGRFWTGPLWLEVSPSPPPRLRGSHTNI